MTSRLDKTIQTTVSQGQTYLERQFWIPMKHGKHSIA